MPPSFEYGLTTLTKNSNVSRSSSVNGEVPEEGLSHVRGEEHSGVPVRALSPSVRALLLVGLS